MGSRQLGTGSGTRTRTKPTSETGRRASFKMGVRCILGRLENCWPSWRANGGGNGKELFGDRFWLLVLERKKHWRRRKRAVMRRRVVPAGPERL
ncbi:hypothetical protein RSOL_230880 [Rhizoctonia solani AG-3 Rhs1AP]|uniref:Uncharacterized protein n=1 Tax=Rhizoctonia solani AG-3 Rhs1AP TaxID=1086054 RepID=X8J873_9AGAM|nr:hypothetical protein RSOL_230880 [Rhizoctonia solani AG-3 Rhs1AP]